MSVYGSRVRVLPVYIKIETAPGTVPQEGYFCELPTQAYSKKLLKWRCRNYINLDDFPDYVAFSFEGLPQNPSVSVLSGQTLSGSSMSSGMVILQPSLPGQANSVGNLDTWIDSLGAYVPNFLRVSMRSLTNPGPVSALPNEYISGPIVLVLELMIED